MACRGVVTIDPLTGATTYNVEYYALGQASVAVDPGAQRVGSNTFDGGIETVAFLNPDGSKVLLVLNDGNTETLFKGALGRPRLCLQFAGRRRGHVQVALGPRYGSQVTPSEPAKTGRKNPAISTEANIGSVNDRDQ